MPELSILQRFPRRCLVVLMWIQIYLVLDGPRQIYGVCRTRNAVICWLPYLPAILLVASGLVIAASEAIAPARSRLLGAKMVLGFTVFILFTAPMGLFATLSFLIINLLVASASAGVLVPILVGACVALLQPTRPTVNRGIAASAALFLLLQMPSALGYLRFLSGDYHLYRPGESIVIVFWFVSAMVSIAVCRAAPVSGLATSRLTSGLVAGCAAVITSLGGLMFTSRVH